MLGKSVPVWASDPENKRVYTKSKFGPADDTHGNGPTLVRNEGSWAGEERNRSRADSLLDVEIPPRQLKHRCYHPWNWALQDLALWLRGCQAWGLCDYREER